jgi:hypothetical protein
MSKGKITGLAIVCFVGIIGLTWIIQGHDFFFYKFWAPKYENVKREVFENTKSYKQGVQQELTNAYTSYYKTGVSESERESIAAVALQQIADLPDENFESLPGHLKKFVNMLREKKTGQGSNNQFNQ